MPSDRRTAPARPGLLLALIPILALAAPAFGYEQQIKSQAQALVEKLGGSETQTLAVVDFTDLQGNVTELGRFLAEELSISLSSQGRDKGLEVIDRTHLKAILEEHKLSATGLIDPKTARELGRLTGVSALVTGTVTPVGDAVRLAVKVLDTETAKIIASTTADIPKTQAIDTLLRREILAGGPAPMRVRGEGRSGSNRSASVAGFLFQVQRCSLSGGTLECSLSVIREQEDSELTIYSSSRAIDEYGDQYEAARVRFGSRSSDDWVAETTVVGIPINLVLTFQEVPPQTSRLALLEVSAGTRGLMGGFGGRAGNIRAQFRDIPVYRE